MNHTHAISFGFRLGHSLRYVCSGLLFRWLTSTSSVVSVGLAIALLLLLGYYGQGIYRYQETVLNESLPTRVVATATDVNNTRLLFQDGTLDDLSRNPLVAGRPFAMIELGVRLSLDGATSTGIVTTLQGSPTGDRALSSDRFDWGRPPGIADTPEIVLGHQQFKKLKGNLDADGPHPETAIIQVTRSVDGTVEKHQLVCRITGLLRHEPENKVYAPLETAKRLDMWLSAKTDSLPGTKGSDRVGIRYPAAIAYVAPDHVARVAEETRQFGITATKIGQVEIVNARETICPRIAGNNVEGLRVDQNGDPLSRLEDEQQLRRVPLVDLEQQTLLKYEIRDGRQPNGGISSNQLSVLRMAQPTFTRVEPLLSVPAIMGGKEIDMQASDWSDLQRYEAKLVGRWLAASGNRNEVVMPVEAMQHLCPGRSLEQCLGVTVQAEFEGHVQGGAIGPLSIPLVVVGVVESERCFANGAVVEDIWLWSQRKLLFDESRRVFETPADVYGRAGWPRCVLDAVDDKSVEPLVRNLEQRGYDVQHQLGKWDGMRKLAGALTFLVALIVSASVAASAITVLTTAWQNLQSKFFEIGLLKAQGVPTSHILWIYAMEGLLLGVAAFLTGSLLFVVGEPVVRRLIGQVAQVSLDPILGDSAVSWSLTWLYALALAVATGLSVIGVLVPAAVVVRRPPVELLQDRR